jgi:hypothetical protein
MRYASQRGTLRLARASVATVSLLRKGRGMHEITTDPDGDQGELRHSGDTLERQLISIFFEEVH